MDDPDIGESSSIEDHFNRASDFLTRNHDNEALVPSMVTFYGLFKQATIGDCNTKRPGFFQLLAKTKWTSWNQFKGTSSIDAMSQYIALLTKCIPNWLESSKKDAWVSVSTHAVPGENLIPDENKIITDYIKEGDLETFLNLLKIVVRDNGINELDETGLGLIHWAADRNQMDILKELLLIPEQKINLQDSDGLTALHYAASCGHKDIIELLLARGIDRSLLNCDGETALDIAYDDSIVLLFNQQPPQESEEVK